MEGKIALEEHWALPETVDVLTSLRGQADYLDDLRDRLLDVQEMRLAEMDEYGIELTILSLNSPGVQSVLDAGEAITLATKANDVLAAEIAKHPGRFKAFAALPMQDADAAIAELKRCVEDLGFVGALVNGFTQKDVPDSAVYFDLPEYRPFWAAVQDLDVPFYLHPRTQIPSRAQVYEGHPWLTAASWGFAVETSVHALRLIGSGLFDEYPDLQIVIGHLGERIPYDMWRLDHCVNRTDLGYPCKHLMGHYLRNNFHMTTSGNFNDATFHCAVAEMGLDRIMFSVDYPFEHTVDGAPWFDATTELTDETRLQVGRENAIKLFKLEMD